MEHASLSVPTRIVAAALITLGLVAGLIAYSTSPASGAPTAHEAGKKGKKGKKKKKKKKKQTPTAPTPVTPAPLPPTPPPVVETLRASLSWPTAAADFDLYVWDADGEVAYYDDNLIASSRHSGDVSGGPEQFFDRLSPSTRDFTYGVCLYDDGTEGTDATRTYEISDPAGPVPFEDGDTLTGSGDWAVYEGDHDPGPTGGWCNSVDD